MPKNIKEYAKGTAIQGMGEYLRYLRKAAKLKQTDVTERTGIPQCKISLYESGILNPSMGNYTKILNVYKNV